MYCIKRSLSDTTTTSKPQPASTLTQKTNLTSMLSETRPPTKLPQTLHKSSTYYKHTLKKNILAITRIAFYYHRGKIPSTQTHTPTSNPRNHNPIHTRPLPHKKPLHCRMPQNISRESPRIRGTSRRNTQTPPRIGIRPSLPPILTYGQTHLHS